MAAKANTAAPAEQPPAEPPPLNETEIAFTPAPALEGAVNEPPADVMASRIGAANSDTKEQTPIEAVADGSLSPLLIGEGTHFRVLSSGLSTPSGPRYRDTVLSPEEIGDTDRITQLLARGSIEVVTDD